MINQEGLDNPVVVTPSSITADWRGGDYLVSVVSPTAFTTSVSDVWSRNTLSTPNAFVIHVDQNDGYARTTTVQVSTNGQTYNITINQSSKYSNEYTLDYEPSNIVFDATGGTMDITIRSDSDWNITEGNNIE